MINDKKFYEQMEQYDSYLSGVINRNKLEEYKGQALYCMQCKLVKEKYGFSKILNYKLDSGYIKQLWEQENYYEIHEELQKLFIEFIPFVLIRRMLKKIEKMNIENICTLINKYKDKYNYNIAMDYIRMDNL